MIINDESGGVRVGGTVGLLFHFVYLNYVCTPIKLVQQFRNEFLKVFTRHGDMRNEYRI